MSKIQWTDRTLNPVLGCWPISPGCLNCYAAGIAHRGLHESHKGLTDWKKGRAIWSGEVRLLPFRLEWPLRWKKPQRIFVCSESDLFHEDVPFEFIMALFSVMARAEHHTFQVLTKRPERMLEFVRVFADPRFRSLYADRATRYGVERYMPAIWPVPNVWYGASAENQETFDRRVVPLSRMPVQSRRFFSLEPLLGAIDMGGYVPDYPSQPGWTEADCRSFLDWIIVGGESGRKARPCSVDWIRDVVRQCREGKVACFVKQLGSNVVGWRCLQDGAWCHHGCAQRDCHRRQMRMGHLSLPEKLDAKGGDSSQWPEDLRVREFPDA